MFNKVVISGGGTGGHIFPAIAIANEIKMRNPNADILFIGALGKMEMEKVPQSGFEIIGLPIVGLQRKFTFSNFLLPFKIIKCFLLAKKILKKFNPDAVVGVGGYASGPTLKAAISLKIPTLIQEQNSYAGKTNKLLSKKVDVICTAYPNMDKFFPLNKIKITGNPVRAEVTEIVGKKEKAINFFGLNPNIKTILVIGGSLGAKTLNESVLNSIDKINENNIQIIWQSGKFYFKSISENEQLKINKNIFIYEFIKQMDLAYSAADVIISRAGALSVSELCIVAKPVILVPSPNVAEDHQTKNAKVLVDNNAAVLVKDSDARDKLFDTAIELIKNEVLQKKLSESILKFALPNASTEIVNHLETIIKK